MIDIAFVRQWSSRYPVEYDQNYYDPYIAQARNGDKDALRKVTEWKNIAHGTQPRSISFKRHKYKEGAFQTFLSNITYYMEQGGQEKLRHQFSRRAPVWAIFWHHVLFQTPIFDVYTNMAYYWDEKGIIPKEEDAKIKAPNHWQLYDQYQTWFKWTLEKLRKEDDSITERQLDRALLCWGEVGIKGMVLFN